MRRAVEPPTPPLREKLTPGVVLSRSETTVTWVDLISAGVTTVIDWPTRSTGWGDRVAVTTSSPTSVGASSAKAEVERPHARAQAVANRAVFIGFIPQTRDDEPGACTPDQ